MQGLVTANQRSGLTMHEHKCSGAYSNTQQNILMLIFGGTKILQNLGNIYFACHALNSHCWSLTKADQAL